MKYPFYARLTECADMLRSPVLVPRDEFDMKDYFCGTAACALGWAAIHGKFDLFEYRWGETFRGGIEHAPSGELGFSASREAFNLPLHTPIKLFGSHISAGPDFVAAGIDQWIFNHAWEEC